MVLLSEGVLLDSFDADLEVVLGEGLGVRAGSRAAARVIGVLKRRSTCV